MSWLDGLPPNATLIIAILGAIGAAITAWHKWFKDRGDSEQAATKMNVDGALALARLLQDERLAFQNERKSLIGEITELNGRFDTYRERSEKRISSLEYEVGELKRANGTRQP